MDKQSKNTTYSSDKYYDLWLMFAQVKDAITRVRAKELKKYNISPQQAHILAIISDMGNTAMPRDIALLSFRKANTVTITLNRMAKRGLIKKRRVKTGNTVRVSLTEKGREVYLYSTRRESLNKILSGLSEKQCQQLKSCLKALVKVLKDRAGVELHLKNISYPEVI
jgi:DNA-binding MarR family transcriptional regulator